MIRFIQSVCIVLAEMMFYKLFMEAFCDYRSREHCKKGYLLTIISSIITLGVAFFLNSFFILKEIVLALLMFLVSALFFDSRPIKIVTLTITYLGLLLLVDYFTVFICSDLFVVGNGTEVIAQTIVVSLSRIILFLLILIIRQVIEKSETEFLIDTEWIKFLFFPFFSICILSVIRNDTDILKVKENEVLLWMLAMGLLGMNIFVFYLIQDISKRERQLREKKIAATQANNQILLYQSFVDNFDKQNEKLHEYKNQIECLQTLSRDKKYMELERYLVQIGGELFHELDAVDTHHAVVNAIINTKYQEAVRHGIVVVFQLNDMSELWLSEHDIVILLANLFDNAMEACKKIEFRRVIKIKMIIERKNLILSVSNTYDGIIRTREGILLSTKETGNGEHGIGIRNIIKIVKKYGGDYIIEPQDKEFIFSIMIPKIKKVAE